MGKKAIITGGVIVALVAGGAFAIQPVAEHQLRRIADELVAAVNAQGAVKITKGEMTVDVWGRRAEIRDITLDNLTGPRGPLVIDQLLVEGIDVFALAVMGIRGTSAEDPEQIIRAISLEQISTPIIRASGDHRGARFEVLYRDLSVRDISGGIAQTVAIGSAEVATSKQTDSKMPIDGFSLGKVVYENYDFALHASLYSDNGAKSGSMRPMITRFSAEPVTIKASPADTGTPPLLITTGKMSSGPISVKASDLDLKALNASAAAFNEAVAAGRNPTRSEVMEQAQATGALLKAIQIDHVEIAGLNIAIEGNNDFRGSTGPLVMEGLAGGTLASLSLRNVDVQAPNGMTTLGQFAIENVDARAYLNFLEDDAAVDAFVKDERSVGQMLSRLPRGTLRVEDFHVKKAEEDNRIGGFHFSLVGPYDKMLERVELVWSDFDIALTPGDDAAELLAPLGIERLKGKAGLVMSTDPAARTARLERLSVDLDRLYAVEATGETGPMDLEGLAKATDAASLKGPLDSVTLKTLNLKVSDRDGGIERFLTVLAEEEGFDLETFKQGLATQAQMLGVLFLGEAAAEVVPALLAFIEDPKNITITATPKDPDQPLTELIGEVQADPAALPDLVNFKAIAE